MVGGDGWGWGEKVGILVCLRLFHTFSSSSVDITCLLILIRWSKGGGKNSGGWWGN